MARRSLLSRVRRVVRAVGVPVAAELARRAVAMVGAATEEERRGGAPGRPGPAREAPRGEPATRAGQGRQQAPARRGRRNRPLEAAARKLQAPAVKVKRGQKHRHHR